MTDERHPIPPEVWERIRAFFASGATGKVTLHVNQGRVTGWEIYETGRVRWPEPTDSTPAREASRTATNGQPRDD